MTLLKDLGRVMRPVSKHLIARLSALEEVEGVSISNEVMRSQGNVSFVMTGSRLLASDDRAKGSALA